MTVGHYVIIKNVNNIMVRFFPKESSLWSAVFELSNMTDKQNPSKTENQSPSFSSFNHDGQLQRGALDEITPTQTTKPSLQRIASSPSFYCHCHSLSIFSLSVFSLSLHLFILLCHLPQEQNNACWCFPCILQRKSWHKHLCNPSKANRNKVCS